MLFGTKYPYRTTPRIHADKFRRTRINYFSSSKFVWWGSKAIIGEHLKRLITCCSRNYSASASDDIRRRLFSMLHIIYWPINENCTGNIFKEVMEDQTFYTLFNKYSRILLAIIFRILLARKSVMKLQRWQQIQRGRLQTLLDSKLWSSCEVCKPITLFQYKPWLKVWEDAPALAADPERPPPPYGLNPPPWLKLWTFIVTN